MSCKSGVKGRLCKGNGLIEVLIAITIASIGLLTLAGVHVRTLRQAKMNQYRAAAMMAATDLIERMRANPAGDYQLMQAWADQASLTASGSSCTKLEDNCTSAELAQADLQQWRARLRTLVPEGRAFIMNSTPAGTLNMWVAWLDPVLNTEEAVRTGDAKDCHINLKRPDAAGCLYVRVRL